MPTKAKAAAKAVVQAVKAVPTGRVAPRKGTKQVWKDETDGLWYWELRSGNGQPVSGAPAGYTRRGHCIAMMEQVTSGAYADAPLED